MVNRVAPTTLGIYVLHPAVIEILRRAAERPEANGVSASDVSTSPFITLAATLVTFFICYKVVKLVMKIPFLRRVVS